MSNGQTYAGRIPALLVLALATLFFSLAGAAGASAALPYKAQLVKDVNPGPRDNCRFSLQCTPGSLGDVLFFSATDGAHGEELWRSDGTAEGTRLVKDIRPGRAGSFPTKFTAVGDTLFFTASDGVHGNELWLTDGTAEGTRLVKDLAPGADDFGIPRDSYPQDLTAVGDKLFFVHDTLWVSDGTAEGTVPVRHFESQNLDGGAEELTNVAGTLFFTVDDGVHGDELWRSDGTEAGTTLVKDIRPGVDEWGVPLDSGPEQLTAVGDKLFFAIGADSPIYGQMWVSDGTAEGTVKLTSGARFGAFSLANVGGVLFFTAEPWKTTTVSELWRSDGTPAATRMVKRFKLQAREKFRSPRRLTDVAGTLFFIASSPRHGTELWKSNGTAAGTRMVKDLRPGPKGSVPNRLTAHRRTLFFVADDGARSRELWQSDGTAAGTRLVKDVNPGPGPSRIRGLTSVGETLFFAADDGTHGRELWKARPLTCAEAKAALQKAQRRVKRARAALRRAQGKVATAKARKRLANAKRKAKRTRSARRAACAR